jgi:hypothetical protein
MDLVFAPGMSDTLPWNFEENFAWNEKWEGWMLASDADYDYIAARMIFQPRLIMTERLHSGMDSALMGFTHGWCFSSFPVLVAAVLQWDPPTQDEPLDWHKRVVHQARKAPDRRRDPQYNAPRCVHGSYMREPCRIDAYCDAPYARSGRADWESAGRPAMW